MQPDHDRAGRDLPDTSWSRLARPIPDPRMLAAIGGLIVLIVVGIAIAISLILDLRHATTNLTEREVEYAAAVGDIALISKALANDERGYLISGSDEFRRQFDGRTAQAFEAFQRAYANANEDQWLAVDRAEKAFESWLRATQENIEAFARGDRDRAIGASLEDLRLLRKEYEARLAGTQSLAVFTVETAAERVADTLNRSVWILLGYLVVAVAVGIAIAAWLVRRMASPVHDLVERLTSEERSGPGLRDDLA